MKNICLQSAVWDLHIHSNKCTKPDKELAKLSTEKYIDQLLSLFADYPALKMISFTDHNSISEEVYNEFSSRGSNVTLLPGIEIDMKLTETGDSKHLVVYFNYSVHDEGFGDFCKKINSIIQEHSVSDKNPILISTLLDRLIDTKVEFAISPHAMKQDSRAITWDWAVDGEDDPNIEKYIDQFFVLWETSGYSQVAFAVEYLKKINAEEKESIVAFSDSNNLKKLKAYLDAPHQYFASLPNFTGLKMVGSEVRRITRDPQGIDEQNRGKYIGHVVLEGDTICLSPKLNAIIGGRGSGKSVLLDRIAIALNQKRSESSIKDRDRIDFILSCTPEVFSLANQKIDNNIFNFEFFNQSYVTELFRNKGEAFNDQLQSYFSAAFNGIKDIDTEAIRSENSVRFNELLEEELIEEPENLINFVGRYKKDHDEKLSIKIGKGPSKTSTRKKEELSYQALIDKLDKSFEKDIPDFLQSNANVQSSFLAFETSVIEAAYKERQAFLDDALLHRLLSDKYSAKKTELSKVARDKSEAIEEFTKIFSSKTHDAIKRTNLIKAYLTMESEMELHHEESTKADGERKETFRFVKELSITSPLEYLIECFNDCLLVETGNNKRCDTSNLANYIDAFRFGTACYKSGKSAQDLEDALEDFDLAYTEDSSVWFRKDEAAEYENIVNMSPGTRTNILLEYIVHRDTNSPLLIDQPEDNVDNQTIYGQIKDWFVTLKNKRQVIVVTHDANIVINADAENIILATQNQDGSFSYEYGALESGNMLEEASVILDGGVEAVRRRLMKYGG